MVDTGMASSEADRPRYGSTSDDEEVQYEAASRAEAVVAEAMPPPKSIMRLSRSHILALVAVCTLSIGSHWSVALLS